MNNDFRDVVFNRHTMRLFDKDYKISHKEMMEILDETTKAPSAVNMQPWRFVVVESPEGKEILRPLVGVNATQNDTSSAMIIIFGDMKAFEKADEIYSKSVEKGVMTEEMKNELMAKLIPAFTSLSDKKMEDLIRVDGSLAAMQLMLVARHHGYETNAIGGFEADKLAAAFGLDSQRYIPILIIAIGKGAGEPNRSIRLNTADITMFR